MPQWKRKIALKDLFSDGEEYAGGTYEDEKRHCSQTAVQIAQRVRGTSWPKENFEVDAILEEMEDAGKDGDVSEHYLNVMMDALYDQGDQDRVWIE